MTTENETRAAGDMCEVLATKAAVEPATREQIIEASVKALLAGQRPGSIDYDVALVRNLEASRATAPSEAAPAAPEQALPEGWRARLDRMRDARDTYSQHLDLFGVLDSVVDALGELEAAQVPPVPAPAPIQMILHCPKCGLQHVDAPDERTEGWTNPPHRSHLCRPEDGGCGHIWRPADVHTEGVKAIQTRGTNDSAPAEPEQPQAHVMPPMHASEALATWPERIWLQSENASSDGVAPFEAVGHEITWSADGISRFDVEYVRADLAHVARQARPVRPIPTAAQADADEAQLYRDLTGDVLALGYQGLADAVQALRQVKAAPVAQEVEPGSVRANECAANMNGHSFGPHGRKGERQCKWCGAAPSSTEASAQAAPTDLSRRLRERANGGYVAVRKDDGDLMLAAADEIERYYGGMLAWKRTAEAKDREGAAAQAAPAEQRDAATDQAIQRACGELPDGYEVIIELENGAGGVVWIDEHCERHIIEGEGHISDDINEAVDRALEHAAPDTQRTTSTDSEKGGAA